MEHEAFVPVPPDRLRKALTDPGRVARAIPGLQRDASAGESGEAGGVGGVGGVGEGAVVGRLKVRVGGTTITYRGSARVTARPDGGYAIETDATESRGTGAVKLTLTVELRESDDGTTVVYGGTGTASGRLTELPEETVRAAATRLLNRFTEQLAREVEQAPEAPQEPSAEPTEPSETPEPEAESAPADAPEAPEPTYPDSPHPPAEAAHARRTMIGRSAEEVDHAPPRGRYAPVPAPQTITGEATLRWLAPAAALAVASAIVVARMLRKRR
ncbi:SRPBCC family protein [Streptomyces sp. YIM S03343]